MKTKILMLIACLFSAGNMLAESELRIASIPEGIETLDDFVVRARTVGGSWQEVGTYAMKVDEVLNTKHNTRMVSVAKFEFEGEVEIEVTSAKEDIQSYCIRPASFGIKAQQTGRTLTFKLTSPHYLSVEINGKRFGNLHIFADKIMTKPKVRKRDLIYFGPGVHRLSGDTLAIPSGKTVFIDQGAVVIGGLSVYKSHDVAILGHGIISTYRRAGINVAYSQNVTIDGPLTTQIPVGGSEHVSISNAKAISYWGWGDGMNIFASSNVKYKNVFCRTSDDCSTIYCTRGIYHGSCRNICIDGAIYWADVAHPIMIGLHSETPEDEIIENVTYRNIDILDQAEAQIDYQGCLGINNGDNILVRNLTFENIRIESLRRGMILNFRVCFNKKYCTAPGRGIEDVTVRNLSYTGKEPNLSIITGYNEERQIKNLTFENLNINGLRISDDMSSKPKWYKTSDMANFFVGEHVENITFK